MRVNSKGSNVESSSENESTSDEGDEVMVHNEKQAAYAYKSDTRASRRNKGTSIARETIVAASTSTQRNKRKN